MPSNNFIFISKKDTKYTLLAGHSDDSNKELRKELIGVYFYDLIKALTEIPEQFYTSSLKLNFSPESDFNHREKEAIEYIINQFKKDYGGLSAYINKLN